MPLLACTRQIAPHTAEVACAILSSKAAGDLLLKFDHSQVTFRAVVIERHTEVCHEAQDLSTPALQSLDDPVSCRLSDSLLLRCAWLTFAPRLRRIQFYSLPD